MENVCLFFCLVFNPDILKELLLVSMATGLCAAQSTQTAKKNKNTSVCQLSRFHCVNGVVLCGSVAMDGG